MTNSNYAGHDDDILTFVTFSIGDMVCGLPIDEIHEIKRVFTITRVHGAPPDVCGVVNIRGSIVTVINPYKRLGLELVESYRQKKMVIIRQETEQIGLLVDTVEDTITISENSLVPPPPNMNEAISRNLKSVYHTDTSLVAILDRESLIGKESKSVSGSTGA